MANPLPFLGATKLGGLLATKFGLAVKIVLAKKFAAAALVGTGIGGITLSQLPENPEYKNWNVEPLMDEIGEGAEFEVTLPDGTVVKTEAEHYYEGHPTPAGYDDLSPDRFLVEKINPLVWARHHDAQYIWDHSSNPQRIEKYRQAALDSGHFPNAESLDALIDELLARTKELNGGSFVLSLRERTELELAERRKAADFSQYQKAEPTPP